MASKKSVDQRLRESELRLKIALKAAQIGIWDWNLLTNEMDYSARAKAIFGFPPDQPVTFAMARDATHPDDHPWTKEHSRRALDPTIRDKRPYEYRIIRADDGETRWVIAHGEAIFQQVEGVYRAVRYFGTIRDITERKRVEEALRESETRQRLAIEAAGMAVWEFDVATEAVHASPALNRMFGFPDDAKPTIEELRACYAPGERERVLAAGREALEKGGGQFEIEFRCRRTDGSLVWLLLRAEIILSADGSPERVIGVLMDIDDRKRNAERQALLARELNHRVKNSLTVIQSLAGQTFRGDAASEEKLRVFQGRLQALAKANNVLLENDWKVFGLHALVDEITAPYRKDVDDPIHVEGEEFPLPPVANVPLAIVLHELCTNAAKYGALSVEEGRVSIRWSRVPEGVAFKWMETGGPPVVAPEKYGFGTRLVAEILPRQLLGVDLQFRPEGLYCRLLLPVVTQSPEGKDAGSSPRSS